MPVFVGRERELEWLEARLASAQSGRGRVVFITGEPGAGKSSLISRFMMNAALRLPEARIIGADCSEQFGATQPYEPFVEAFRDLISAPEKSGSRWSELRELATEVAPAWIEAIPVAGAIISASISTAMELRKGGVATAAPSEEALFFQYTELFFAVASKQPVILFIDDLHWADSASVSLLTHLARRIKDKPVLIIGTFRPADVDVTRHPIRSAKLELERYGVSEELALPPLDERALAALIEEELDAPPTPDLLEWLTRNAGENPLFFVELLRWLVEQEYAKLQHGEWALVRVPESITVPQSAESAIERRLSRLDPEVYKVVEYASVQGNEFDSTTLSHLLGMDELELEEALEPVVKSHRLARLVDTRELPSGDLASIYHFTHSLIQDVLHNNLQGKRRILLHRKAAEALERLYGRDLDGVAERLAFHFDEGRIPERAYEFALRGSARASRVYAHRDALQLIRLALRNARDDVQKLDALDRLGSTSHVIGNYADALQAFTDALDLVEERGDVQREISIKRQLVEVELSHGGIALERVRTELEQLAGEARTAVAYEELCQILWRLNQLPTQLEDEALARNQEALDIAQRLGDPALIARAEFNLGFRLAMGDDQASAMAHIQEALRQYETLGDDRWLGRCRTAMGVAANRSGDLTRAADEFAAALQHFEKSADPINRGGALNNLGTTLTQLGRLEEAEKSLRDAVRIMERLDAATRVLSPLENLSFLYYVKEDWPAAREFCQLLLERAQATGYWSFEVIARSRLGLVLVHLTEIDAAAEQEAAARQILADHEEWFDEAVYCHLLTAELAAARGDAVAGAAILDEAEQRVASRDRYLWAELRLARGRMAAHIDRNVAAALLTESLGTFGEMGAKRMQQRAEALLAKLGEQP